MQEPGFKAQNLKLPIIVGPTGVGKSEVAYHLALRLKAEIISADAFQIYKGLEVGTAQPSREWRKKIKHHLTGSLNPVNKWNAVEFAKKAKKIIVEKKALKKRFLLVGGAGFYIKALVEGAPPGSAPPPGLREEISLKVRDMGNEKAHAWLKTRDPGAARRLHPNDRVRICRALEKTFTVTREKNSFKPLGTKKVLFFGLERSRDHLDDLLRARTEKMWRGGLLEEARKLTEMELSKEHPLWGAIGYAEASAFIRGEMQEKEAVERIFRRTRQYAKRQWTWFKHQHKVEWINLDDHPDVLTAVDILEKRLKN